MDLDLGLLLFKVTRPQDFVPSQSYFKHWGWAWLKEIFSRRYWDEALHRNRSLTSHDDAMLKWLNCPMIFDMPCTWAYHNSIHTNITDIKPVKICIQSFSGWKAPTQLNYRMALMSAALMSPRKTVMVTRRHPWRPNPVMDTSLYEVDEACLNSRTAKPTIGILLC